MIVVKPVNGHSVVGQPTAVMGSGMAVALAQVLEATLVVAGIETDL